MRHTWMHAMPGAADEAAPHAVPWATPATPKSMPWVQQGAMRKEESPPTDRIRRLLLAVPNRRRIYEEIVRTPGTHLRRLQRELGLALGSVEHHLRYLEDHGLVFSHKGGRRRTYYASDSVDADDAAMLHALRNPLWADILAVLALGRESGVAGVAARVGTTPDAASYHLRRMRDRGLLEQVRVGRESAYFVREPGRLLRLCDVEWVGAPGEKSAPDPCFLPLMMRTRRLEAHPEGGGVGGAAPPGEVEGDTRLHRSPAPPTSR